MHQLVFAYAGSDIGQRHLTALSLATLTGSTMTVKESPQTEATCVEYHRLHYLELRREHFKSKS